jgi:hypothetical protein
VTYGHQFDSEALAALQSAVVELASMAGMPAPGLSQPVTTPRTERDVAEPPPRPR